MGFGETVSPIATIRAILHDYPYSASILRELLQNSDDAGATKQIFVLDNRDHPALLAYNDAQFRDADWEAIQSIHQSSKKADTSKIGKYGVGFRACYHITDRPQILSGSSFAVLDPLHSKGMKIDYNEFRATNYCNLFDFFADIYEPTSFPGTVIRLPLRSSPSELSQRIVHIGELRQMVKDYIAEEMNVSLLFLEKLKVVGIREFNANNKTSLATWTKSKMPPPSTDQSPSLVISDSILSSGDTQCTWRVVQAQSSEDDAKYRLSKLASSDLVNHVMQKHKLRPDVRIAYPISSTEPTIGRLFTFLPLPSKTGFPVHIHALFALTSSRQGLRNPNETGIVQGSDNDVLINWNQLLFDHYIPQAWSHLLKNLAEGETRAIFAAWPPRCSSITSGDGVYWQDILQRTYRAVIGSRLNIWPKVSARGTANYVELKSSLVVSQGQVNTDTLSILSELDLTLVELPHGLIGLVDDTITKLAPRVVHDNLQGQLGGFTNLSREQRAILSRYLLSDKDIRKIFGLPLLPVLNGSFVSLGYRQKLLAPWVALEHDEVAVFKASAGDAIPLDQLSPEVATLIREQGPSQANVDSLSPKSVVHYLSNAPQPFSDGLLADFWNWLGGWHLKSELVELLKSNPSLCLIPTTNGPQAVSSPVFVVSQNADTSLLGKLGLAFITSSLPPSAIQLLDNYHILKDANNLNDVLAAISSTKTPSLTNKEAEILFDHVAAYYGPLSLSNLSRLRRLPIFPVLVPEDKPCDQSLSNCSTTWRSINDINIKGISPMKLVPVVENAHFLGNSSIRDPSSPLMEKFGIRLVRDDEMLLHALEHFASQSKPLQVAFISYIKRGQDCLPSIVKKRLQETQFLRMGCSTLCSPSEVIDPNSPLAGLFSRGNEGKSLPKIDDSYDRQLFNDLQALGLMKTHLSIDLICERISYISSNPSALEANTISRSLLVLMNDTSFSCSGLTIDPNMHWLPTENGLVSSNRCIDSGRQDSDLFDNVLMTLDSSMFISPSFKALLNWDKPLPLDVLMRQLDYVLGHSELESHTSNIRRVRNIIRELAGRQLQASDVQVIQRVVTGRRWIPTNTGNLAPHSRAVFTNVRESSGFYEIGFSVAEQEIYRFLVKMGCQERPSVAAIVEELTACREMPEGDGITIQKAVQLLEMLPNCITEKERASLLVPEEAGSLVPLTSGICYYPGSDGSRADTEGTPIAHHLITEKIAEKLKMNRLGLAVEDSIELGEKPITTIRNTLRQYDPKQFFTEFIANASDASATQFSLLIDDHQGPTKCAFSEGMKDFQSPSLVVYNNGVFTENDFKGIRETGIGGKREEPNMIGRFGLGALSMFHFTELAMIVSGSYALFLNPAKRHLSYHGRNSVLLPLQQLKRLYGDHLEPLDGLFGFDLSSTEPYQGTLFRLPLRTLAHLSEDSVSATTWQVKDAQDMFLEQFDNLAYKSLLFTGLNCIDILTRQNSQMTILRKIESTRALDKPVNDARVKAEITTFKTSVGQEQWLVLSIPTDVLMDIRETLENEYKMRDLLPVQIAAGLDDVRVPSTEYNLFCSLPLPITTSLPVHISAPLILEQERRNIRLDNLGQESKYNRWLLSSEVPRLYIILLERVLQKKGTNMAWWPGIRDNAFDNAASRTVVESFWTPGMLGTTSSRVFVAKYRPGSPLTPKEAVLFSECRYPYEIISKVVASSEPLNIVEVPPGFYDPAAKAELCVLDPQFMRGLLEDCQQLTPDEINDMLSYLHPAGISLHGLSLLPLEDGSLAPILEEDLSTKPYYTCEFAQNATWPPFRKDRLVHHHFLAQQYLLDKGYNVSQLSEIGIVELAEECVKSADEIFGDAGHETWVTAFWDARLSISPDKVSHLPLVATLKPLYFISLKKVDDPSVIVVAEETSADDFDYNILQNLGMTIVVKQHLPYALQEFVTKKKHSVYRSFLDFMYHHPKQLALLQRLETSKRGQLSRWVRSQFSGTPGDFADIACKLPVWPVQQRTKANRLAALNDVMILPRSIPSEALRPFTEYPVIDWDDGMKSVEKEPCSAKRITELLRVSAGYILLYAEPSAYQRLLEHLLVLGNIDEYCLLVPNESSVLTPVRDLFERHELFLAAFKSVPSRLLSEDLQDMAERFELYGLKCHSRLDVSMFVECASAFNRDTDSEHNKRARSVTLYQYFNSLPLSHWPDSSRCSQLDDLKFIPRADSQRPEYGNIDTVGYMINLPQNVLSPSQITLPEFEPICWSQKGRTNLPPNATLCGTYQTLGKPIGAEVIAHLKVLAKIGQEHGCCAGLLSDLKSTYKWLNDNVEDIRRLIAEENTKPIFLNVNNPESDEWVWRSARTLVIDLRDVYNMHDVRSFLRTYKELLKAAGVGEIQKVTAIVTPPMDKTSHFRERFAEMRNMGRGTDVTFNIMDNQHEVPPAHSAWLSVNSNHFWLTFITSDFQEAGANETEITPPEEFSSLCVKEVISWIYTAKLPESVTSSSNGEAESKTKLELALDMLSLSDCWQVMDLHEHLQTFIINAPDFINPYWVKRIRKHAANAMATQLIEACKKYEEGNQSFITDDNSPEASDEEEGSLGVDEDADA